MQKKYIIRLTKAERQTAEDVVKRLKGTSQKSSSRSNIASGRCEWRKLK